MREFLLVPYWRLHPVPPPPANQVIHVTASQPIKGVRTMDALWVEGAAHCDQRHRAMGTRACAWDAQATEPKLPRKVAPRQPHHDARTTT